MKSKQDDIIRGESEKQIKSSRLMRPNPRKVALVVILVLALAGGGFWAYRNYSSQKDDEPTPAQTEEGEFSDNVVNIEVPMVDELWIEESDTVQITDSGFSTNFVYALEGTTVTWSNASGTSCRLTLINQANDETVVNEEISNNSEYSYEANSPGEYVFRCAGNTASVGSLTVVELGGTE
jgi:plastocyanin